MKQQGARRFPRLRAAKYALRLIALAPGILLGAWLRYRRFRSAYVASAALSGMPPALAREAAKEMSPFLALKHMDIHRTGKRKQAADP